MSLPEILERHWALPARGGSADIEELLTILREAREALAFGPNVEFPNLPIGTHLTGPDVLVAVAHWMDRKDDEWEGEAAGSGLVANRDVQGHLRDWSDRLRALLARLAILDPTETPTDE